MSNMHPVTSENQFHCNRLISYGELSAQLEINGERPESHFFWARLVGLELEGFGP